MKRIRVHGHASILLSTVIEVDDDEKLTEDEIYERASEQFSGIDNYAGMGDCDHLIGVCGDDDTIFPDSDVEFDDYEEE